MSGLLRKELYGIGQGKGSMLFVLIIWTFAFFHKGSGAAFIIPIAMVTGVLFAVGGFSQDKAAGWDSFVLSLPVSRGRIVAGKYLACMAACILAGLVSTVMVMVLILANHEGIGAEAAGRLIENWEAGVILAAVYAALSIPLTIWLGAWKARLITPVIYGAGIVAAMAYPRLFAGMLNAYENYIRPGIAVVICACLFASWAVSVRIYERKEY